jgi:membrane-bound lytic murein transglycosylase D
MKFAFSTILILIISCSSLAQKGNGSIDTSKEQSSVEKYGFQNLFVNREFNTALPYDGQIHPQAWGFIQDYLDRHQKNLSKMKSWGLPYFTLIENVLMQYNLPHELKYLAVIESGLNTNATSWVGARGPWQFMPGTARDYGLMVSSWMDERTDYFRSTHAAAKYLTSLYSDLNDWLLVIAAYMADREEFTVLLKKAAAVIFGSCNITCLKKAVTM